MVFFLSISAAGVFVGYELGKLMKYVWAGGVFGGAASYLHEVAARTEHAARWLEERGK